LRASAASAQFLVASDFLTVSRGSIETARNSVALSWSAFIFLWSSSKRALPSAKTLWVWPSLHGKARQQHRSIVAS
jgi:hypothetical protein